MTTRLIHSGCGIGNLRAVTVYLSKCSHCGETVHDDHDIKPYLDPDERLTTDEAGLLVVTTTEGL